MSDVPEPRKGMPPVKLDERTFRARFLSQFADPAFEPLRDALAEVAAAAWQGYAESRKSPRTRKAGPGFADPDYELATDWIAAHEAVNAAGRRHRDPAQPPRVLLVNAAPRSEHSCPGEMSKSWRLAEIAENVLTDAGIAVEMLDLSRTVSEYGRNIHPCKACFSTAAALCHWPCSCYPNYALGQTQDWMNEIYPMWVRAHGVMIVTPVHWYQATTPLKAMIDRLVCADGGNPDPSSTHGKDAKEAKALELDDWPYPRHLEGRLYAVVVHGDADGVTGVRRALSDWMASIKMVPAGPTGELARYIGYFGPYATSHEALDDDRAVQEEVANAARTLAEAVFAKRAGRQMAAGAELEDPRRK